MKKLAQIFLSVSALCFMGLSVTHAQQIASVAQLREEIREFEVVARDANTPGSVKSINGGFLTERRERLRTQLQYQLESLRKYETNYQAHLSAGERQVVLDSIRSLEIECQKLENAADSESAAFGNPPTVAMTPPTATGLSTVTTAGTLAVPPPQTQVDVIRSAPNPFSGANAPVTQATLDFPNAAILNPTDAGRIIREAIADGRLAVPPPYYDPGTGSFSADFYCVVHVLRWANESKTKDASGNDVQAQTVAAQNWYVFNSGKGKGSGSGKKWSNEDFTTLNRLFGVKNVWLLYLHLNSIPKFGYQQARYDFNIEKKAPQNVSNLFSVAQLFITFTGAGAAPLSSVPLNYWGGGSVDLDYVPSNVTITANIVKDVLNGPVVAVDKPKKFDNEGRYWWDISVAVPVRHISETQFDTTANTVTAKKVDKQNAFALLNLYPVPVDLKGSTLTWIPHFVGGVAIAKQPLKKFLLGVGFGPTFANFYVAAVFTEVKRPATLKEGDGATPAQLNADLRRSFKPKFSFGFNLPIRGVLESLKKESK
jgi:hypothetical protein